MGTEFIDGIFHYCDRWCKRCPHTARCALFAQGSAGEDAGKNKFRERFSQNLSKARTAIEEAMHRAGIDTNAIELQMLQAIEREKIIQEKVRSHVLSTNSLEYAGDTRRWLQTQPGMLEKLEKLKEQLTMGIESQQEARRQTHMIKDSLEEVQWYASFIHDKLESAMFSFFEREFVKGGSDDHNGSAKAALIAIDRSREAWEKLFEILPEQEDHFLTILAKLEKIRRLVVADFPDAFAFVRPGLDETVSG